MAQPVDLITNEIRRRLSKMDRSSVDGICEHVAERYSKGQFKRATDLIEEGVKLAKKLDKENK